MSKILNYYTSRQWNVEVAKLTGNLDTAIIYGQLIHHYENMGEFSKTNEEMSQELNMSVRTFKRHKKLLIDKGFILLKNSYKNRSIYKVIKKFDYFDRSYRKYDINYCLISKDNYSGILLGHLIYLDDYFTSRGEINFYKTNECLQEELFMSERELKRAKKNLIDKGFISVKRGSYGKSYYTIHNDKIFQSILLIKQTGQIDPVSGPKRTIQLGQNAPSYINIQKNIYNILLFYLLLQTPRTYARVEKEKKINKNNIIGKNTSNRIKEYKKMDESIEAYKMIGIWKEKIPNQDVYLSTTLIKKLQDVLKEKFQGSVDRWKDYVERISQNEYLTGKTNPNWTPKISWFSEPHVVDKVIGGYFGGNLTKKNSFSTPAKLIPFAKEELINEVMEKEDNPLIQRARVTIIDLMSKHSNNLGLSSYQSHLRRADFTILTESNKKTLVINSFYGSYNSLMPYHNLISAACTDFDEVLIFSGPMDKRGDYIYRGTLEITSKHIFDRWDSLKIKESSWDLKRNLEDNLLYQSGNEFKKQVC